MKRTRLLVIAALLVASCKRKPVMVVADASAPVEATPFEAESFVDTFTLDADPDAGEKVAAGACPDHLHRWAEVKVPFLLR